MANCYHCQQTVVFSKTKIGKNGRPIPLDPTTELPHDCPKREKKFNPQVDTLSGTDDKDDHGNEFKLNEMDKMNRSGEPFVDHTAKGQSKVKIFFSHSTEVLETQYNGFLYEYNGQIRTQGAQFQVDKDGTFAIALYYEETK